MRKPFILIIALIAFQIQAQERDSDTLNPNTVNVVKPYTPSVKDAFKVKESPTLDDEETTAKQDVEYNILSFPVASTFKPAKGKATTPDKAKKEKLFDNYVTAGAGNYNTILGEIYLNHDISRDESVGAYFGHNSSWGSIDDVEADTHFSVTDLSVNYGQKLSDASWKVEAGGGHAFYNWYGIPQDLATEEAFNLDVAHNYMNAHLGGNVDFMDSYFNSAKVLFRSFWDDFDSAENNLSGEITADIPVSDQEFSTKIHFDYLSGSFDRGFTDEEPLEYSNFQLGLAPTYQLRQDDLTVDLGVTGVYLNNMEADESKFFIYPNVALSYKLVSDLLILYGGVDGGLVQNTYYGFAEENPFVSPTLLVSPTDRQFHVFGGLKGKVTNTVSYNVSGGFMAEKGKALFKHNLYRNYSPQQVFDYGNAFNVVYDDVNALNMAGELNVDVSRNFTLGLKGEYFVYDTDVEEEAWNLPEFKASLFMDYQIGEKWFTGANLFFVGERSDVKGMEGTFIPEEEPIVTLDSYFDANIHLGYHITEQFSIFAHANNLAGSNYQRWVDYPVQGFQALAGLTYQFDF